MAVFLILAVALMYRHTSAQKYQGLCSGVLIGESRVKVPLDVCAESSNNSIITSSMYSCSGNGNAGYLTEYDGAGCSGSVIFQKDFADLDVTAVCNGNTCDYAVWRNYRWNGEDSCELENYDDEPTLLGCVFLSSAATPDDTSYSRETICVESPDPNQPKVFVNDFLTMDCGGSSYDLVRSSDLQCLEVISCSAYVAAPGCCRYDSDEGYDGCSGFKDRIGCEKIGCEWVETEDPVRMGGEWVEDHWVQTQWVDDCVDITTTTSPTTTTTTTTSTTTTTTTTTTTSTTTTTQPDAALGNDEKNHDAGHDVIESGEAETDLNLGAALVGVLAFVAVMIIILALCMCRKKGKANEQVVKGMVVVEEEVPDFSIAMTTDVATAK